jgi:molybdopterin-guanine dinucleotide biosynthesis protein MobB
VVPTSTSLLLPIVGFEIFDAPLTKDIAHRSEIISEITGIQIGETITVEILSSLLRKGNGYLKGYKPKMRVIPILTKVPPDARKKAIEIAEKLLADFPEFESVVIGNLARDGGIPELWQERVERQNTEFQPTLTINEQIPIWKNLPVLSVCGHKNSGKTTLLEKTICELKKRGLKIAAVKHDVHCITVDQPGTDSDRLYRAGASVLLRGEPEVFQRQDMESGINQLLYKLAESHDIVLVEGYKKLPLPKVWVLREDETAPPNEAENILGVLPWNSRREVHLLEIIDQWLSEVVQQSRIAACVLIGGSSKRMKNPKHLLQDKGVSWIERTVDMVSSCVEQVVISGNGELPTTLSHLTRLPDITEAKGPMAGILAAMRWSPRTSWLFIPCDLPGLTPQAIRWLLDQRKTGRWVIYPRIPGRTHFEPLFAIYDFRITASLEKLTDEGDFCPFAFLPMAQAWIPEIPKQHAAAWQNVNSPEQLLAFHNQQNKEKLL